MRKIQRGVIDSPIAPESSPVHDSASSGPELKAAPIAEAMSAKLAFALPPVNSLFLGGVLTSIGNNNANTIEFTSNAAGKILVNGSAPLIGNATLANTKLITAFGLGGDDVITLNETNGALPRASLSGGAGNDVLTSGSGADLLFGGTGNDTLFGKGGNDALFGGAGNDVLVGGDGDDQMFGEAGDDRMIWNPGEDNDLMEGGAGIDTAEINGGGGNEVFTVTANGARVRFDRVEPAPFFVDIGTTEKLVVNMGGGNDTFSATGDLATLISVTVDGGAGNDTILGSNGVDQLIGGEGDDFIDGQQGNDVSLMGAGNDVFQWDPGDGSDTVEGQDGTDSMLFNGSGGGEIFAASANGGRVLFTRNLGNIVMDLDDVESIDLNALAGTDTLTVNDLSGTDVVEVNVDLAATIGGTVGDGEADSVIANATNGADDIDVVGAGTSVSVVGLAARTNVTNSEVANDSLRINGLGGDDTITATTFQWDPGDGNDTVEGQDGNDTMLFLGAGANENVDITANGGRVLFNRSPGNVVMDLNDVERIDFRALGGADNIVINDLSGTDVTQIDLDLRGPNGGGDGAADTVTVNATNGADEIGVAGDAEGITVSGLQAGVNIVFQEQANDRLTIDAQGGDDVINASGLKVDGIQLTMNGGLGEDLFIGSDGDDLINGGDGDDTALMGAGDDTFVWNPGEDNDTIEGQDGFDTMLFNGANVAENVTISANGGRSLFSRDIASVTMDMNDVESIDFNALGGADSIVVRDLSGTDVVEVNVALAGTLDGTAGDGQADTVTAEATNGDDVAVVVGDASGVSVLGLAAQINVTGAEAGNDRIVIKGFAGDDVIEASGVDAGVVGLTLDGGDGDDVLVGGEGDDILLGGAGDDVLIGGGGNDILDGGDGDDVELEGFVAGAATDDQIDLSGRGLSFDWLMAHASDVNGDTILDLGDQQITLRGVSSSSLHTDDFILS
jgi:Ca2+-binding RTX toxin-like protein